VLVPSCQATWHHIPEESHYCSHDHHKFRFHDSAHFVFSGLGLSSTSSGRRDSFDRNTSAFSPSLDYGRPKWATNYGALGM